MRTRSLLLAIFLLLVAGCGIETSCGEDHSQVAMARQLSEERLALLYHQVTLLRETRQDVPEFIEPEIPLPEELKDLGAVRLRHLEHPGPRLTLAGCMDEYVFLRFRGESEGKKKIVLEWFAWEGDTSEVLWSSEG